MFYSINEPPSEVAMLAQMRSLRSDSFQLIIINFDKINKIETKKSRYLPVSSSVVVVVAI